MLCVPREWRGWCAFRTCYAGEASLAHQRRFHHRTPSAPAVATTDTLVSVAWVSNNNMGTELTRIHAARATRGVPVDRTECDAGECGTEWKPQT